MHTRQHSYQALLNLARETLQFPAKGIVEITLMRDWVRGLLEPAALQDRAELPYSYEGGAIDYMIAVHTTALRIRDGLGWKTSAHSVFLVSLLHPLGRIMGYNREPYFVPKLLADQTRSEKAPWKRNPDLHKGAFAQPKDSGDRLAKTLLLDEDHIPDGLKALGLIESQFNGIAAVLSPEERLAIRHAFGAYELGENARLFGRETQLQHLVHSARIIALRNLQNSP